MTCFITGCGQLFVKGRYWHHRLRIYQTLACADALSFTRIVKYNFGDFTAQKIYWLSIGSCPGTRCSRVLLR